MIWKPEQMKVRVEMDRMGNILADPVSDKRRACMIRQLRQWYRETGERVPHGLEQEALVFAQDGFAIHGELVEDWAISRSELRDLEGGWPITIMVPVETFERYVAFTNHVPDEVFGGG